MQLRVIFYAFFQTLFQILFTRQMIIRAPSEAQLIAVQMQCVDRATISWIDSLLHASAQVNKWKIIWIKANYYTYIFPLETKKYVEMCFFFFFSTNFQLCKIIIFFWQNILVDLNTISFLIAIYKDLPYVNAYLGSQGNSVL